ncbi:hypothetical protein EG68_11249 [Paragonimus skrjabini miyazakii]|uniref:Secreted protein n=1 Tax=Paragonimus skrjabini miyazakii TaxID=59628 RepID=A0A8S9YFS1_9TREM|nr:hypothetical protein EG68_11249 [Paragonimus skrjabini miyazakii]
MISGEACSLIGRRLERRCFCLALLSLIGLPSVTRSNRTVSVTPMLVDKISRIHTRFAFDSSVRLALEEFPPNETVTAGFRSSSLY